ncbi:MAG: hypothetical protein OHK0047_39710 [Leptolyngbyaceae cyanobacterium]
MSEILQHDQFKRSHGIGYTVILPYFSGGIRVRSQRSCGGVLDLLFRKDVPAERLYKLKQQS